MEIIKCVNCGGRVIPQADHTCPGCGKSTVVSATPAVFPLPIGQGGENPYRPVLINPLTAEEIEVHIAKRRRGVRTSIWWMVGSAIGVVAIIVIIGQQYLGGLFFISFLSGLIGFVVDRRALRHLLHQREEMDPGQAPTGAG